MKIKLSEISLVMQDVMHAYVENGVIKAKHITNADDPRIPDVEYDFASKLTLTHFFCDVNEKLLKREINNEKDR